MCINANKSTYKYLTKQSKFRKRRKRRCQEMQSPMRTNRFIIQTHVYIDRHTQICMYVCMWSPWGIERNKVKGLNKNETIDW